jgi:hypothetical protein
MNMHINIHTYKNSKKDELCMHQPTHTHTHTHMSSHHNISTHTLRMRPSTRGACGCSLHALSLSHCTDTVLSVSVFLTVSRNAFQPPVYTDMHTGQNLCMPVACVWYLIVVEDAAALYWCRVPSYPLYRCSCTVLV